MSNMSSSFKSITFSVAVEILRQFYRWLKLPDQDKDPQTAFQHARQVFTILRCVSPAFNPQDLLNTEAIKEEWLTDFLKTWRPGTAKSYLGSVIAFYDFCLAKRKWNNMHQELQSAIADLKRVGKSMRKRSLRRRTEKETADIGRFQER